MIHLGVVLANSANADAALSALSKNFAFKPASNEARALEYALLSIQKRAQPAQSEMLTMRMLVLHARLNIGKSILVTKMRN